MRVPFLEFFMGPQSRVVEVKHSELLCYKPPHAMFLMVQLPFSRSVVGFNA